MTLTIDFPHPVGTAVNTPTLMVRVRDPTGAKRLVIATTTSFDGEITQVYGPQELVQVLQVPGDVTKQKIEQYDIVVAFYK